jgi:hypothetical protein
MNKEILILSIVCRQAKSKTISEFVFDKIENIKNNIKITKNIVPEEYIILKIWNEYDRQIKNLSIELEIKLINYFDQEIVVTPPLINVDLKNKQHLEITLFEISKFKNCLVSIKDLHYEIDTKFMKDFVGGHKFSLNVKDIEEPNAGFINYNKRITWFLLINYYLYTLYHRGYLLKLMVEKCKEINKNFNDSIDKNPSNKTFQILIQIDIISKIMLYTEDLIVSNSN